MTDRHPPFDDRLPEEQAPPASWTRLVEAHYHFQSALYQPRRRPLGFGEVRWHPALGEPDWNHGRLPSDAACASLTGSELDDWLDEVGPCLAALDRPTVVAVGPGTPAALEERLRARGWGLRFRHRWALWQGGEPQQPTADELARDRPELEQVRTPQQLETFLGVFFEGFAPASRVGPRRLLEMEEDFEPGWRQSLERSLRPADGWAQAPRDFEIRHYLARLDGEPAGVATAFLAPRGTFAGFAGFYNLAVRPAFRRRGLGRALHAHRLREAWALGCRRIFLQTEDASVEDWNRRHGWGPGPELVGWGPEDP